MYLDGCNEELFIFLVSKEAAPQCVHGLDETQILLVLDVSLEYPVEIETEGFDACKTCFDFASAGVKHRDVKRPNFSKYFPDSSKNTF